MKKSLISFLLASGSSLCGMVEDTAPKPLEAAPDTLSIGKQIVYAGSGWIREIQYAWSKGEKKLVPIARFEDIIIQEYRDRKGVFILLDKETLLSKEHGSRMLSMIYTHSFGHTRRRSEPQVKMLEATGLGKEYEKLFGAAGAYASPYDHKDAGAAYETLKDFLAISGD